MLLVCATCSKQFQRQNNRGTIPKYCSQSCKSKAARNDKRIQYDRERRRKQRAAGKLRSYEFAYNRRESVREKNRRRMKYKWYNDTEYRNRELIRMRVTMYPNIATPSPFTGHRWLDMAREAVNPNIDPSSQWADDYYDDMGEALLALLEGRDMKQAVKEYRNKEYIPRRLTIRLGDFKSDESDDFRWFEKVMPTAPSAEDEYLDSQEIEYYTASRFNDVSTRRRQMPHRTQQPSRRRMNNK